MEIQFSQQELALIRNYFDTVDSGRPQKQGPGLPQALPEWNTIFLVLRKLLAYGIYYTVQSDSEVSYNDLQTKSQKPDSMLVTVHTYLGEFKQLLAVYIAHHVNTVS